MRFSEGFWKYSKQSEMRAGILVMDSRFQAAMRRSLEPRAKRDFIHIGSANTEHLQAPTPDLSFDMPSWKRIVYEVATKHHITVAELIGGQRSSPIVAARHEAMYRMKTETAMNLPAIGRRLGGRDHTTVLHGVRRYEASLLGKAYAKPLYGKAKEAIAANG